MIRFLLLALLAVLLTAAAWVTAFAIAKPSSRSAEADSGTVVKTNATHVYVNGLPLRQPALVKDGVTYVPLRAVSEALGCNVDYSPRSGVFIWGNPQQTPSPDFPGLPPSAIPPDPRPAIPQPPLPGLSPSPLPFPLSPLLPAGPPPSSA